MASFLDVPSRHGSQRFMRPRDNANIDSDDFLSSDLDLDLDLELSFASNVSIHSPPASEALMLSPNGESDYAPMDISPAPPPKNKEKKPSGRPRAFTSGARLFGRDMSNGPATQTQVAVAVAASLSKSGSTSSKRIQRSALPLQWFEPTRTSEVKQANANVNGFSAPLPTVPASPGDDAMDVDSSYTALSAPYTFEPTHPLDLNLESSPTITSSTRSSTRDSGFNNLFYEPLSPRRSFESPRSQNHRTSNSNSKRRSLSPEPCISDPDFSSPGLGGLQSSPSQRKLERMSSGPLFPRTSTTTSTTTTTTNYNASNNGNNGKPTLQGLGAAPSSNFLKRPRRPVVSAIVNPTDLQGASSAYSAYPSLSSAYPDRDQAIPIPKALPPTRRAFSALLPPTSFLPTSFLTANNKNTNTNNNNDPLSADESSFDADLDLDLELDMSSPAQAYAKRQHGKVMRTIRRCDGMEDFRAGGTGGVGGVGMAAGGMQESPSGKYMSMSMSPGLPGFGDNEAHGKILPCRRVTEDGLMRITCHTLDDLLDGVYKSQITDFHIIDCRFDYEYNGGHIPGAVNINTTSGVEELLLGSGVPKPRPSVSGDAVRKTVLVFHCEFSAKRAPTFAKHLRAKDRALNNHFYPKIHYPEVYILEGGYCQYFKTSAVRCEPPAYVTMDDPTHAVSRREDLDQFRRAKFGRHKSYAYGDGVGKLGGSMLQSQLGSQGQQSKRNTAPSGTGGGGTNPLFAAANAARTRRAGSTNALSTLNEDGGMGMSMAVHSDGDGDGDDDDTDIGDSPCPPPTKGAAKGAAKGGSKGLKLGLGMGMGGGRVPLVRAETYGPGRMQY